MDACESTVTPEGVVCAVHGNAWVEGECLTQVAVRDLLLHRQEQFAAHGANRDLEDGTGQHVEWLKPVVKWARDGWSREEVGAEAIENLFREEWDYDRDPTQPYTWMQMMREEVAEAFGESDLDRLDEELTQVGALVLSWKARLAERRLGAPYGTPS